MILLITFIKVKVKVKVKKKNIFRLVASRVISKADTISKYVNDNSNYISGMRVKLTYTFKQQDQWLQYFSQF